MRQELDDALCQTHPLIFAERHGDPADTAMCWGFETGDGWFALVDELCRELQRETDEEGAPQVVASQVKSKGGALRFHVGAASDRQRALIDFAQLISRRICESCGAMGHLKDDQAAAVPGNCSACSKQ